MVNDIVIKVENFKQQQRFKVDKILLKKYLGLEKLKLLKKKLSF